MFLASLMQLSLNSMEKSHSLQPFELSESFLVAGLTFLDKTYLEFT